MPGSRYERLMKVVRGSVMADDFDVPEGTEVEFLNTEFQMCSNGRRVEVNRYSVEGEDGEIIVFNTIVGGRADSRII